MLLLFLLLLLIFLHLTHTGDFSFKIEASFFGRILIQCSETSGNISPDWGLGRVLLNTHWNPSDWPWITLIFFILLEFFWFTYDAFKVFQILLNFLNFSEFFGLSEFPQIPSISLNSLKFLNPSEFFYFFWLPWIPRLSVVYRCYLILWSCV